MALPGVVVPYQEALRARRAAKAGGEGLHAEGFQGVRLLLRCFQDRLERPNLLIQTRGHGLAPRLETLRTLAELFDVLLGTVHGLTRRAQPDDGVEGCRLEERHVALRRHPQGLMWRIELADPDIVVTVLRFATPAAIGMRHGPMAILEGNAGMLIVAAGNAAALADGAEDDNLKGARVEDDLEVLPSYAHVAVVLQINKVVQRLPVRLSGLLILHRDEGSVICCSRGLRLLLAQGHCAGQEGGCEDEGQSQPPHGAFPADWMEE
mmetsp:Transcript_72527/g.192651  ORF Transcript_72527/g.192651 Transcript_72527/m.192651 type:complete len:265 (-) Transcript_72527:24-818(-)